MRRKFFRINQLNWSASAGVSSSFARIMCFDTTDNVVGETSVKSAVITLHNINEPIGVDIIFHQNILKSKDQIDKQLNTAISIKPNHQNQ